MNNPAAVDNILNLQGSFEQVMAFRPLQANELIISEENIKRLASEEGAAKQIVAGAGGVTPGMRHHLIEPAREFLAKWQQVRGPFDSEIHPFRQDIESVDQVDGEIERLEQLKNKQVQQIELRADADLKYQDAKIKAEESKKRYKNMKNNESGREANIAAYGYLYWPAIMMIGVTEWLINYDTFFSFLSVPAIAAGATIILGILLAFSAHGHGTLLKQWSFRFGDDRKVSERRGQWRFLILSTFSLLLVLLAAGGARYESAIRVVVHLSESATGMNVLGSEATIESSPLRDVLLSLLANVAAWAVGVFLAYLTHDENPVFMDAAKKSRDDTKRYQKLHKKHVEDERQIEEAKVRKGISDLDASAKDRRSGVQAEYNMWVAVKERDADVRSALAGVIKHNLELYRDALMKIDGLQLVIDGKIMTPRDYYQVKFQFDNDLNFAENN